MEPNSEMPFERLEDESLRIAVDILNMATRYQEDTIYGEGRDTTVYECEPPFSLPRYIRRQSIQRDSRNGEKFLLFFKYSGNFSFSKD